MPNLSWEELSKLRHILGDGSTIMMSSSLRLREIDDERAARLKEDFLVLKKVAYRFDDMILKHNARRKNVKQSIKNKTG